MITTVRLINISSSELPMCVYTRGRRTPEIYSPSKFPVFSTVLLTIVIMLYIRPLDLFIQQNCSFIPCEQHRPTSPASLPFVTTILLSASMYLTFLGSMYK